MTTRESFPNHDNNSENQVAGPSLLWTIKTAFNNYQVTIDKYESLLLKISELNNTLVNKMEDFDDRLKTLPEAYVLKELNEKDSKILEKLTEIDDKITKVLEKLTKMILVVSIVSGIGLTTFLLTNRYVDNRLERTIENRFEQLENRRK